MQGERRKSVIAQRLGRKACTAQIEDCRRIGEGARDTRRSGHIAREILSLDRTVQCRQRKIGEIDVNGQIALTERHTTIGADIDAAPSGYMRIDIEPIIGRGALGIGIESRNALLFELRGRHASRRHVESDIGCFFRAGDAGCAVDRAAKPQFRLERIGQSQRQIGKGDRKIETTIDHAIHLDLPRAGICARIDDDIPEGDFLALHGNGGGRGQIGAECALLHMGRSQSQFKTAIFRLKRTGSAGDCADFQLGIGSKIGFRPGCIGLGIEAVDAESADHYVARRSIAVHHRHAEQVLCRQGNISRGDTIAIDLDVLGIGSDRCILATVIGVERDISIGRTGRLRQRQGCCRGNIRRIELQRAGQETFRGLGDIARKMRTACIEDEVGQTLLVIDDVDERSKINTLAIKECTASKLAGKGSTCLCISVEHGIEIETAFGKLATGQSALRRIGAQRQRDQLVVAARTALDGHPPRCLIGKKLQIGQHDAEVETCLVGCKGTIGSDFAQLIADTEITRRKPFAAAAKRAAEIDGTIENAVDCFRAGAHVLCCAVKVELECTADRANNALGVDIDAACKVTVSQSAERRKACNLGGDIAIEGKVVDITLEIEAETVTGNIGLRQLDRRAGAPCAIDGERNLAAKRLGNFRPFCRNAIHPAIDLEGDMAIGGIAQVLGNAAHIERDAVGGNRCVLETGNGKRSRPVIGRAITVSDLELCIVDIGFSALDRQEDAALALIGNGGIDAQLVQEAVIAGFGRSLQFQGSAVQRQIIKAEAACILQEAIRRQYGFGTEEIAEYRRYKNRDRTVETGRENTSAIGRLTLPVEREFACQRAATVGVERKIDLQLVKRTGAFQSKIDRRTTIDVQQVGDDAVSRFRDFKVEIDLLVRIGIGRAKGKISAGTVETLDVEI